MFILTPIAPLKNVTSLIPNVIWKFVYQNYLKAYYLGAPFSKETLKDHLQETLKKLKMGNSNEESSKQKKLQCDEVLK